MIDFAELAHELHEDYIEDTLLCDTKQLESEIKMMVDNGYGYHSSGFDYEGSRVVLQKTSIAFIFMMHYNKELKHYLVKREESKYDDPILSTNKLLREMMFTLPEKGLYVVALDKDKNVERKNYMILKILSTEDEYGYKWDLYFVGDKWRKYRNKFNAFEQKYVDEIKALHYEMIVYTDGTQPKDISFKPFDKMVFSSKEDVINYIDTWVSHIPDYHELNVPCKLSILLHGVPGTGKSTFAQALAKHLGIDTIKSISPIYFSMDKKDYHNKYQSVVYLLDDLDSFVFDRESDKADRESNNILGRILAFLDNPPSYNYKLKDGRVFPISIVVATTNYFDKLDPAIKRYGRFDFQLEMNNLNEKEADELCHTYSLSLYDILDPKKIKKDAEYSPAYIQALCLANLDKKFKGEDK